MRRIAAAMIVGSVLVAAAPGQGLDTSTMNRTANGTFEVKLSPQADGTADVGRMTIDKTFSGDLAATSVGQMIAVRTPVEGSAGYVAMERVTGQLHGRKGSFALQHSGTMNHGTPTLTISVVPDSGTEDLAGLTGSMDIIIIDGQHAYVFDYQLPDR